MSQAIIKVNGKDFTLNGTETEIKQQAISLISFKSGAEQDAFLKALNISEKKEEQIIKKENK